MSLARQFELREQYAAQISRGTKLHMSSAFHSQTEAANRVIVMYLRCFTGDCPRQWLRWLPWAEYVYNTAYQSSLHETLFRVVYGCYPPSIRS